MRAYGQADSVSGFLELRGWQHARLEQCCIPQVAALLSSQNLLLASTNADVV